jgi:predicted Fe-Mo cluster-binding NifX family protein
MITSIMGRRAQEQFAAECIRVVYGVASETHENVLQAFLEGSLS